jgi:hypothetical protein
MIPWAALLAQEIQVFSEFRRVGPNAQILEADRGGKPREILSPAIPRNGFATFHLVFTGPVGQPYHIYVGENPEGLLKTTLYRILPNGPVPDALEKVDQPVSGIFTDAAVTLVLDLWTPPTAPVRRVRVEAQLNSDNRWVIYPMEVRLQPASLPPLAVTTGAPAPVTAPAVETSLSSWDPYLCSKTHRASEGVLSIRSLLRRNASQDVALAKKLEARHGAEKVRAGILAALGAADSASWCADRKLANPETYLRVRDFLYKLAIEGQ